MAAIKVLHRDIPEGACQPYAQAAGRMQPVVKRVPGGICNSDPCGVGFAGQTLITSGVIKVIGCVLMKFRVIIREDPEDGGYVVSCPAIPGCHSQGETLEEALDNIKDAISGCIEVLNERVTQRPGERLTDVAL